MGILRRNKVPTLLKNMRFSANRALTVFEEEGVRTERVEEHMQYTRHWSAEVLKLDPNNAEALMFKDFPEPFSNKFET